MEKVKEGFRQTLVWDTFWAIFFTNSSGHPVFLVVKDVSIKSFSIFPTTEKMVFSVDRANLGSFRCVGICVALLCI
jgi:hypothetical protein